MICKPGIVGALWLPLLIVTCAMGQETQRFGEIKGRIVDQTGNPIENVSVFVNNTTYGDASDKEGRFHIPKIPEGRHILVASMMGYEVQQKTVELSAKETRIEDFRLRSRVLNMDALEISAADADTWRRHLREFKRLFLGNSAYAHQCEILNEEMINFSKATKEALVANAEVPIVLENRALGYRLELIIEYFKATSDVLRYSIQTRFDDLESDAKDDVLRWRANRKKAYLGSLRHFLVSLLADNAINEGFNLFALPKCPDWRQEKPQRSRFLGSAEINIRPGRRSYERNLSFAGCLQVTYLRERAEEGYNDFWDHRNDATNQTSWIEIENPPVTIDLRGNVLYRGEIKKHGYWAWKRVGDLLPTDYQPQ